MRLSIDDQYSNLCEIAYGDLSVAHFFNPTFCSIANLKIILSHWISEISRVQTAMTQGLWALEVFESWGSKEWPGPWRARGARAYNLSLIHI